ncbi:hypothetical protein D9M68_844310 [compost metagenome]
MPAALATRPMASASFISPPLAGSHVSEIMRTLSSIIAERAFGSTLPSSLQGMVSILAPAWLAARCIDATLPPHSCRPIRMRSPDLSCGNAANTLPQRADPDPPNATSPSSAPMNLAALVRSIASSSATSAAASIGPRVDSSIKCPTIASVTRLGGSEAPA